MSIFFISIIAATTRLAAARSGSVAALVRAIGVICQDRPHLSLHHPHALSWLAVADDCVPVAIGFGLLGSGDLKRECFVVLERGPAAEPPRPAAARINMSGNRRMRRNLHEPASLADS